MLKLNKEKIVCLVAILILIFGIINVVRGCHKAKPPFISPSSARKDIISSSKPPHGSGYFLKGEFKDFWKPSGRIPTSAISQEFESAPKPEISFPGGIKESRDSPLTIPAPDMPGIKYLKKPKDLAPRINTKKKRKRSSLIYGDIKTTTRPTRIIFIIDVSVSMKKKGKIPGIEKKEMTQADKKGGVRPGFKATRLDIAKTELIHVINNMLTENDKFNVISFSTRVDAWQKSLVQATPENKKSAIGFVNSWEAQGATNTDGALRLAFEDKKVDTIYLLSDGSPTKIVTIQSSGTTKIKPKDKEKILTKVKNLNQGRKVTIHTIALLVGKNGDSAKKLRKSEFMRRLAHENSGKFKLIDDKGIKEE